MDSRKEQKLNYLRSGPHQLIHFFESSLVGQVEFSGHPLAEAFLLIGSLQSG